MWEPIALALLLTLLHYFSEHGAFHVEKYYTEIVSLSAGMFLTYIILEIFPELPAAAGIIGENAYLALLAGFVAFHLSEKYVYQHVKHKKELLKDLAHLHVAGFVIDHFVVGFALVLLFDVPGKLGILGWLVFIPFVLHIASSSLSLEHICRHFKASKLEKLALSLSTLVGAVVATAINLQRAQFFLALSFVIGMLVYVVVRDVLPQEREGKPYWFLVGVLAAIILIELAKIPA
jgi:zinc transporter ZupT